MKIFYLLILACVLLTCCSDNQDDRPEVGKYSLIGAGNGVSIVNVEV